jgi:hypothetical protein
LGFSGCEGEFETTTIVGHGGETVIRGKDERTTYRFVGNGIYDYPSDVLGGVGVSCVLGCDSPGKVGEKGYSQRDRCQGGAARDGRVASRRFFGTVPHRSNFRRAL